MSIRPAGTSISRFVLLAALVVACGSDPEHASIGPSSNSRTEAGGGLTGIGGGMAMSGGDSASPFDTARATGGASATTGGLSANSGGAATTNGGTATGGRETSPTATGGRAIGGSLTGGTSGGGGTAATAGRANGGAVTGGAATGGVATGGVAATTGGRSAGGAMGGRSSGAVAGANVAGTFACDVSAPPANVAAWIDESWGAEGRNNMLSHKTWLHDAAMKGQGEIKICVRYGATQTITTATRDLIAPSMQRWFNKWFAQLFPYACFPHPSVTVNVSGWAVKPGQESLLEWSDRTIPVYTEVSDGTDQAKGEPKCPDACGFFFHSDHVFTNCPGGVVNHFDYALWLNDKVPSGAAAEGSDWGVRIPVASFLKDINTDNFGVMLHEMGHGFGLSDYYSWTGSTPTGGSIMFPGSAGVLTLGDQWMVRRYWKETKAVRYP